MVLGTMQMCMSSDQDVCMCRGMRLEVVPPSKVAMLPLAAACTDSLKQFQEVPLEYQMLCSHLKRHGMSSILHSLAAVISDAYHTVSLPQGTRLPSSLPLPDIVTYMCHLAGSAQLITVVVRWSASVTHFHEAALL